MDRLESTLGDQSPSRTRVQDWYNERKCGRRSLKVVPREGCPISEVLPDKIETLRKIIEEACHIAYREVQSSLGSIRTSAYSEINDHSGVQKLCSRWIPHLLADAQKGLVSISRRKSLQNSIALSPSTFMKLLLVKNHGYKRMIQKQSSNRPSEPSKMKKAKVLRARSVAKQMIAFY